MRSLATDIPLCGGPQCLYPKHLSLQNVIWGCNPNWYSSHRVILTMIGTSGVASFTQSRDAVVRVTLEFAVERKVYQVIMLNIQSSLRIWNNLLVLGMLSWSNTKETHGHEHSIHPARRLSRSIKRTQRTTRVELELPGARMRAQVRPRVDGEWLRGCRG